MENYGERLTLVVLAIEESGHVRPEPVPSVARREVLHRCGSWVRKDHVFCSACGHVLHRKDGSLI